MIWHSGPDKKHCIAFKVDRIWRFLFLQHKPKETVPCSVAWRDMNDSCLVYYSKCPENWVLFLCNILHLPSVFTKKITNVKMRNIGFSRTGNTRKPLNFFFSSSVCLSVQLPTAALTTLQQTGAWSTGPDSAQGANYSIIATAVTAWSDWATLPAGSTPTGFSSGTHHRLFVKVNIQYV